MVQCAKFSGNVAGMENSRLEAVELCSKHSIKSCIGDGLFGFDDVFVFRTNKGSDKDG